MAPTDVLCCGWAMYQPRIFTLTRNPDPLALHRSMLRAIRGWQEAGGVAGLIATSARVAA